MENILETWQPRILSVLRIVSAFILMQHGTQKMFGFPAPQRGEFELFTTMGAAGTLETFGGFLLLIGLFTRPIAFLLSGLMASAYFMAHAPKGFWPLLNGGELAAVLSFLFLYLVFTGGGSWSVDSLRSKQ